MKLYMLLPGFCYVDEVQNNGDFKCTMVNLVNLTCRCSVTALNYKTLGVIFSSTISQITLHQLSARLTIVVVSTNVGDVSVCSIV